MIRALLRGLHFLHCAARAACCDLQAGDLQQKAVSPPFLCVPAPELTAALHHPKSPPRPTAQYGIPPSHYKRWPVLAKFFSILTTTKDRNGLEYISTVEAKDYPFTGTQWWAALPSERWVVSSAVRTCDAVPPICSLQRPPHPSTATHPHPPADQPARHPEKPTSEFGMEEVPHTLDSVRVGQFLSNNLVDAARCVGATGI
jgi:gamma-glutamyl hydrolase